MSETYRPRLSVDISEELRKKLDYYLPDYGRKKEIITVVLNDLFDLFEKHGAPIVIGALVERAISLKDICKLKLED